ncbi:hypothetical protein M9H77_26817 [Catharanthus roseus]|uniref:Uncharacterized protein n=1 Tax=Catharanthus roseus TaxID=4058 RepID=A0ACC0ABM4_CATRO|nr:hypothetical protein M9H77_26817 [Catharanthus roseus]
MRGSSAAGKFEESRYISAASTPKFKRACNATVGFHRQSLDPKMRTLTLVGMGFSYVFTNRKAAYSTVEIDASHKHCRTAKILIYQSSHAYADVINMLGLHSCTSDHVTFQD